MHIQIFAIKDRATNAFMQPFFAPTIGAAVRAFVDGMNDDNTPMAKHPDDYDLWHLGDFDDQVGHFTPPMGQLGNPANGVPIQIAIGKNVRVAPGTVSQ